jgi:hypothetical protein
MPEEPSLSQGYDLTASIEPGSFKSPQEISQILLTTLSGRFDGNMSEDYVRPHPRVILASLSSLPKPYQPPTFRRHVMQPQGTADSRDSRTEKSQVDLFNFNMIEGSAAASTQRLHPITKAHKAKLGSTQKSLG